MRNFMIVFLMITIFIIWLFFTLDNELSKSYANTFVLKRQLESAPKRDKYVFDTECVLDSAPCSKFHKIVIIVTCYVGHVELRSAHRRALPSELLENLGIKRVFLLAKIPKLDEEHISQNSIKDESNRFGDIVQGDFVEAYRNLTFKHVMGLKWAQEHCSTVDFIIKVDDDIVFNIFSIVNYINKYKNMDNSNFLLGYVMKGMKPIRLVANKWFVTISEYRKTYYPPFASGWMYVTTPQTAAKLVSQAMVTPYFWIDDVFVTGILTSKLGIRLKDFKPDNLYLEYSELMDCCIADMVHKNISCEYSVAPNGGDNNKFVKFVKALDDCSLKRCALRSIDKPLKKTCVSLKNIFPIKKGKPVVNILKL